MGHILHIKADGTITNKAANIPPTLEECREAVRSGASESWIEIVRVRMDYPLVASVGDLYLGAICQMIVHESGLLYKLPINKIGTDLYRKSILPKAEARAKLDALQELFHCDVIHLGDPDAEPVVVGDVLLLVGDDVQLA